MALTKVKGSVFDYEDNLAYETAQTLTGAGAVSLVTYVTYVVTTGTDALTLADGSEGQHKYLIMKTDGGVGTLTPTNASGFSTITFNDVGDSVHLLFTDGNWHWLGGTAVVNAPGAIEYGGTPQTLTGAGAVDVISAITYVVTTGANALTLADGVLGQRKFILMTTDAGDGTLTPSNLGNGSTITFDDVGDSADLIFANGSWHMIGGTATLA